jgi:TolB-like protein
MNLTAKNPKTAVTLNQQGEFPMNRYTGFIMTLIFIFMLTACGGGSKTEPPVVSDDEVFKGERITVAVMDFDNNAGGAQKEELAGLQTGLTDMFIAELGQIPAFNVIERTRLTQLANELALPDLAGLDADTVQQIGRLLGAQVLYLGSFTTIPGRFSLSGRLVRVETGEIITATSAHVKYNPDNVLDLVDEVSKDLRRAINKRGRILLADIDYSKGKTAEEEEGDVDKALGFYRKALEYDPKHQASLKAIQRLEGEE